MPPAEKTFFTLGPYLLRLPLEERTRLLAEQAEQMKDYYEQSAEERQDWQSGDFQDEH